MSADERPPPVTGPGGATAGAGADEAATRLLGPTRPRGSLMLVRIAVAALALLLLIGSLTHIGPAVRAGLHEGTRGFWVVTGRTCNTRKACVWNGKFVLPSGHVQVASIQYEGTLPTAIHAGTRIPVLYPGGGLVFPTTGSDLWISLIVAMVVALLGLYWASRKWVAGYLRQRNDSTRLAAPVG